MLDPTATHLPIWEELFKTRDIKTVLEFGCGDFSTTMFHSNGCKVTAIEMQHPEWFEKIRELLPEVDLKMAIGPHNWMELGLNGKYDAIFVDGHGDSRPECMMWAKDHTDLIVAHDTEHPYYGWERADMSGFTKTVYDQTVPWTTVWIRQ